MPRDTITILHISDMQFGKNHSFGTYGPGKKPVTEVTMTHRWNHRHKPD
jgi:hypothetical protein